MTFAFHYVDNMWESHQHIPTCLTVSVTPNIPGEGRFKRIISQQVFDNLLHNVNNVYISYGILVSCVNILGQCDYHRHMIRGSFMIAVKYNWNKMLNTTANSLSHLFFFIIFCDLVLLRQNYITLHLVSIMWLVHWFYFSVQGHLKVAFLCTMVFVYLFQIMKYVSCVNK